MTEDVRYHMNDSADSEDVEEDDVHLNIFSFSNNRQSRQKDQFQKTDDKVEISAQLVQPDTFVVHISHSFVAGKSSDKFDDSNGYMEEKK